MVDDTPHEKRVDLVAQMDLHENRIEALRAASRIVAGSNLMIDDPDMLDPLANGTMMLAEQFAKWLETGER